MMATGENKNFTVLAIWKENVKVCKHLQAEVEQRKDVNPGIIEQF